MDHDRWKQIEEVFDKAIGLSAKEREPYLAEVSARDPSLREEIDSLISSFEEDGAFLQSPVFDRGLKVLADEAPIVVPGDRFGNYKIVSKLGSGGMGSVYLAIDSRLGRKVAIKFLSSNLVEDRNRVIRFRQEARAASKISHPNVAAIYEIGSSEKNHFITMEFVDGTTVRERLSTQSLPLKEAIDIAIQVGLAIEAAHALGIVHRDIKPENIMIRGDGYVKVLDFGLAKLTETYHHNTVQLNTLDPSMMTVATPTEPGLLMGTAMYMSPEQARGLEVDGRTDIWSWGVVLYEMVTGETPFQGATTSDLLADILRGEPRLLLSPSPRVPNAITEILRKSLAKEAGNRFPAIGGAITDLREIQKSLEAQVEPVLRNSNVNIESESDVSARKVDRLKTGETGPADITDSHVIADNFPTSKLKGPRNTGSLFENFLAKTHRKYVPVIALFLSVALVLMAAIFAIQNFRPRQAPRQQLEFTKLSSEENVMEAIISPDGKYVASVVDEAGSKSLWVRQISTSANLQIVPPGSGEIGGLSFSTNGDSVYYLEYKEGHGTLFSVSALGGAPRKLIERVETPVAFSPDGLRMAFVRGGIENATVLTTANPDGSAETILAKLDGSKRFVWDPIYSTGPAWSPDGKVIASAVIDEEQNSRVNIVGVQVADGAVKSINVQKGFFARVRKLAWLINSTGLLVAAKDQHAAPHQLWYLSFSTGETRNITKDADDYFGLSLTGDGRALLTTRTTTLTSVWVTDRTSRTRQIPSTNHNGTNGLSWTGEGQIVYARNIGSSSDLWVMNSDGSKRKQLTFDGQWNLAPAFSPDGRYLLFVSYREGRPHVWRVGADGTGLKQLTDGTYEDMPIVSHDGKWVIYRGQNPAGLWKTSIDGGEPISLVKGPAFFPDVSPVGENLAYLSRDVNPGSPWQATIVSLENGALVKTVAIQEGFSPSIPGLRWTADGSKVSYVISVNGVSNIWSQPISGGPPAKLSNFGEGEIFYFSWSKDGQLACVRGASTKDLFLIRNFQ